jgi:L-asparaginase II
VRKTEGHSSTDCGGNRGIAKGPKITSVLKKKNSGKQKKLVATCRQNVSRVADYWDTKKTTDQVTEKEVETVKETSGYVRPERVNK